MNCGCECSRGEFCGGCGHVGCSGGINLSGRRIRVSAYVWQCEAEVCVMPTRDMTVDRPEVMAHRECRERSTR